MPEEKRTPYSIARAIAKHSAARYLVIGGSSFVIDFGLVYLLHDVANLPLWIATVVGFLTSFVFNYFAQKTFSFGSRQPHGVTLLKYAALVAFNAGLTVLIVSGFDSTQLGWEAGKVIATIVTTGENYFVYRYWIFRKTG